MSHRPAAAAARPTARQLEVLRLVADDLTDAQVAARLGVAVKTVDNHLTDLRGRLGVHGRAGLVATAFREGWLR